jgi:galactokinase
MEPIGPLTARPRASRIPPQASAELLAKYRFDERRFAALQDAVADGSLFPGSTVFKGSVAPPEPEELLSLPLPGSEAWGALEEEGRALLARGEAAVVILAGGMATRFAGAARSGEALVKGTVEVTDGYSFLTLKIAHVRAVAREVGRDIPIAVMASFATEAGLRKHIEEQGLLGPDVAVFAQSVSLRLEEGGAVFGADRAGPAGTLPASSYTTPGHGDFFEAVRVSGVLQRFRDRGARMIWLCNVDNLGATLSPALLAVFAEAHAGRQTTFLAEVVERRPEDGEKVGVVVRATSPLDDRGAHLRILEGFRAPADADGTRLREVSINSFTFDLDALDDDVALDVHAIRKEVDGRRVIQGESILCEATGAVRPDGSPRFRFDAVRVPRSGAPGRFFEGRFAPVKTPTDLEALRGEVSASLPALLPARTRRRQRAIDGAVRGFAEGGVGPTRTIWSPGRINLIGEHTDYSEGLCLPAAVDHGIWAAVRARDDGRLLVRSSLFPDVVDIPLGPSGPREHPARAGGDEVRWGRSLYVLLPILSRLGVTPRGAQIALESDLPPGAGMSSSAAFHLAVAGALARLAEVTVAPLTLARAAQETENALGVRVGILDPYAITHARRGYALRLDCRSLTHDDVPLSLSPYALVVADTGKARGLVDSAYNERRAQCEEAARALAALTGRPIRALRDVTLDDLAHHGASLPPLLRARATHVVEENVRVDAAVQALEQGDLRTFGTLLQASHRSLRDLFAVSCFELDALVDAALALGSHVVPGARMMGGGFGGSTLSLVRIDALERFFEEVRDSYRSATGLEARFSVVAPEDGLGELRS